MICFITTFLKRINKRYILKAQSTYTIPITGVKYLSEPIDNKSNKIINITVYNNVVPERFFSFIVKIPPTVKNINL